MHPQLIAPTQPKQNFKANTGNLTMEGSDRTVLLEGCQKARHCQPRLSAGRRAQGLKELANMLGQRGQGTHHRATYQAAKDVYSAERHGLGF